MNWRQRIPKCNLKAYGARTLFNFYSNKNKCEMLVSAGGDNDKIEIMSLNDLRKVQVKNSKFENEFEGGLSKWTVINTFKIPKGMCRRVILSSHGMLCTDTQWKEIKSVFKL